MLPSTATHRLTRMRTDVCPAAGLMTAIAVIGWIGIQSIYAQESKSGNESAVDSRRLAAYEIREIRGEHLVVYTDVRDRKDVDELTTVFDQAISQWSRVFQIEESKLADWRLDASVIVDQRRFEQAGLFPADLPTFLAGYQRGDHIWVYVQPGEYYTRHLLLHEGTHAVMNQFLGGLAAPWYAEGMAELVGLNRWANGQLTIAHRVTHRDEVPYWGRVALLRKAVEAGQAKTLNDVLAIPGPAFRQVESYAWAWAACEFLSYHPISAETFASLSNHCGESPTEFNRRLTEPLADRWRELEFEWQMLLQEVDYGYDVAAAAIAQADAVRGDNRSFSIAADRGWQVVPVVVTKGQAISIVAQGEFQIAHDSEPWPCQANGVTIEYYRGLPLGRLIAAIIPDSPDDDAASTAAPPTAIDIGPNATITPDSSGRLLLRINDSPARLRDNNGFLRVRVE